MNDSKPSASAGPHAPLPVLRPLNRVPVGATVIVRKLTASDSIQQRLREMGFGEDQRVRLISLQSNILCQVCNARLGLNERLAECIWVEWMPPRLAA